MVYANLSGSVNGNADTATKWVTARTFSITDGEHNGNSVSVDGSGDVKLSLPTTINADVSGLKSVLDGYSRIEVVSDTDFKTSVQHLMSRQISPFQIVNNVMVAYASMAHGLYYDGTNHYPGGDRNSLLYIVAQSFGQTSGYVKLSNGLLVQWIFSVPENTRTKLPIGFSSKNYYAGAIPSYFKSIDGLGADLWMPTKETDYITIGTTNTWTNLLSFDIFVCGY